MTILVILPVLLVAMPAVLVTHFFGRRPTFAAKPTPPPAPDVRGLRDTLERTAQQQLPGQVSLGPDAIHLTISPDRLAARTEKISRQARELGGSASEGLPAPKEKHLYVELPAGKEAVFRKLVSGDPKPADAPATSPAPGASPGAKDHVEVILHAEED
jgi:hypothetical protein